MQMQSTILKNKTNLNLIAFLVPLAVLGCSLSG